MKAKDIDEKAMATLLGITLPTVKKFLSGADQKYMLGDMIYKVSNALGIPAVLIIHRVQSRFYPILRVFVPHSSVLIEHPLYAAIYP